MDETISERQPPACPVTAHSAAALPAVDLRHVLRMTDDTGMLQHGLFAVPDPNHGYCIDDNARALIAALRHAARFGYDERAFPLMRYLTFLTYAFNEGTGSFRNFMSYDRKWLEAAGSHDSQARTMWALGLTVKLAPHDAARDLAAHLVGRALPGLEKLRHLRSWAFLVIGFSAYLDAREHHRVRELRDDRANWLMDRFNDAADEAWPWWEDVVTYDNGKLSQALLTAGHAMGRDDMIDAGCRSLAWLLERQTADAGHLSIIGADGWMTRDGQRAPFGQQPLEAYAMVDACLTAARVTGEAGWADHARRCFAWFLGDNDLGVPLYNEQTGGCHDGLEATGPNQNQGAESTLAYVLSLLRLHGWERASKLAR